LQNLYEIALFQTVIGVVFCNLGDTQTGYGGGRDCFVAIENDLAFGSELLDGPSRFHTPRPNSAIARASIGNAAVIEKIVRCFRNSLGRQILWGSTNDIWDVGKFPKSQARIMQRSDLNGNVEPGFNCVRDVFCQDELQLNGRVSFSELE